MVSDIAYTVSIDLKVFSLQLSEQWQRGTTCESSLRLPLLKVTSFARNSSHCKQDTRSEGGGWEGLPLPWKPSEPVNTSLCIYF